MSCALLQHEGRNVAYVASVALGEDVLRAGESTELVLTRVTGQNAWVPAVTVKQYGQVLKVLVVGPGTSIVFDEGPSFDEFFDSPKGAQLETEVTP